MGFEWPVAASTSKDSRLSSCRVMSPEPIRPEDGRGSARLDAQMTAASRHLPDDSTSPLVSICIPTFNADRWIQECLESALAQIYPRFEVLIIDHAPTHDTGGLV